ncbi:MAG: helix-turn-helix domain-containing protein [Ruminococcus sp.]|nr:helix-turn-helix domain-containing protein [Ruminococcus sp.]
MYGNAKVLGVSEQTVYRLIHSEELPAVKIRFRFKIKAADLEKYVNRK